jgi:D-3-phosphoglycerate dehydrogenase
MRIVLCYPVEPRHLAEMAAVAPGAEIVDAGQERITEEILEADIFCGHAKVPVPWDDVVAQGRLKWIQSSAAGMDHCLVPSVLNSDILVTSASGLFADQVAEQTLALLLGLLRGLPAFFRATLRKEFIRRPTRDLHGATVGIIGLGGNGRRIADVLAPFRTRILATDLFPCDQPPHVEALWGADRLDEVLPLADIVILTAPLNELTRGMIGRRELSLMKQGSLLINVARGPVVVESDLVAALESGHLAGAGLDVTEIEPLPESSRLWELPNVLITPHVGAQSARRYDDATRLFCDNLRRYLAGEPLVNVVDKRLGFPVGGPRYGNWGRAPQARDD